jgi:hypothetical protein
MPVLVDSDRTKPAPARADRSLLAILLLAVAALAGSIALLPGSEEKAAGLLAEGRYGDAIATLTAVENERPLNAYEGYVLFKLYLLTSQPDAAARLLAQDPELGMDNEVALRQLSNLYRQQRDMHGEALSLRQLYDLNPNDVDFARLRTLYRLAGDADSEASLLAQALASGRTDQAMRDRLTYLQTPASKRQATLWLAPDNDSATTTKDQSSTRIAAYSALSPTPTPSIE